jgi:exonuclease SbcD
VTIRVDVRDSVDPMATILATIDKHDVTDAVVRVIIQAHAEQEGLLRDSESHKALKEAYFVASISREIERAYRLRLGGESPEELSPAELLTRYLESKGTEPDRIVALLQRAEEIFQTNGL